MSTHPTWPPGNVLLLGTGRSRDRLYERKETHLADRPTHCPSFGAGDIEESAFELAKKKLVRHFSRVFAQREREGGREGGHSLSSQGDREMPEKGERRNIDRVAEEGARRKKIIGRRGTQ